MTIKKIIKSILRVGLKFLRIHTADASVSPKINATIPENKRRQEIAASYLQGKGIEIGALHLPLEVPLTAEVRYVDHMPEKALRWHYPELEPFNLVPVDLIDDGERLRTLPTESVDFVISNHMIEHAEDPVFALNNWLRVLKKEGILYLGVPDMRHTFDKNRPVTPLEHLLQDFKQTPAISRKQHYQEWSHFVDHVPEEKMEQHVKNLEEMHYSIHFHVWTPMAFLKLLLYCQHEMALPFEIVFMQQQGLEFIVVLKKIATLSKINQKHD
ncbi:methyltransferase domain-containing protein [Deltaproteobacteria bacterium TL4]